MDFKQKVMGYLQQDHRVSVEITEPGLEATIYFSPITVIEFDKILTMSQGSSSGIHIWTLIEKAEDEQGKKMFSIEDKPFLERLPWTVVNQVTSKILKVSTIEETKKNFGTTPST